MEQTEKYELITLQKENAEQVFSRVDGIRPILDQIKKVAREFKPDISTAKGRAEIKSMAAKIATSKVTIDNLGKDVVSEWKEKSKLVDAERKKARDELDDLKEEVRKPLTDWEEREEKRLFLLMSKVKEIEDLKDCSFMEGSAALKYQLEVLEKTSVEDANEWQEFILKAQEVKKISIAAIKKQIEIAEKNEAEKRELEKFRAEKEKKEREEREEKIRAEAAEKATREANERARIEEMKREAEAKKQERLKKEAEERAEKLEEGKRSAEEKHLREIKEAEERAAREQAEAIKASIEKERLRIEKERIEQERIKKEEERLEQERKRDKEHRASILKRLHEDLTELIFVECGMDNDYTDAIIKTIISTIENNDIKNISINF